MKSGVVTHTCNLSTQEVEEGGSKTPGQYGVKTIVSQKNKNKQRQRSLETAWLTHPSPSSSFVDAGPAWGLLQFLARGQKRQLSLFG
jgi:hypothetical protein